MASLMTDSGKETENLFKNSALYHEFLAEREEILKHKWLESERAGYDVGFEKALLDWIVNHRATWRAFRQKSNPTRAAGDGLPALMAGLATAFLSCYVANHFLS